MQIAINVLVFLLGLIFPTLLAFQNQEKKRNLSNLTSRIRCIINTFKARERNDDLDGRHVDKASNESVHDQLLTKEQVEQKYGMDSWQRLAYEDFKATILARGAGHMTFPCVYATIGFRAGDHRYVFLHSDDPSEPRNIRVVAPALREYLRISRNLGPNTSLVIMAAPTEGDVKSVEEYNDTFWEMLRGLRIWDSKPWPEEFPQDTRHEKWSYCFDGMPLFPVALTPAHKKRWSRHAAVPLIALQPKWVLDRLLATPEKRQLATSQVRRLLTQYDQIEISPDLTQYGEEGTSEIYQLCLRDENESIRCPFDDFDKGSRRSSTKITAAIDGPPGSEQH